MLYTLTVYVHLIAACSAIGVIVILDLKMLKHLFNNISGSFRPDIHLEITVVISALVVLWLSGVALVLQGIAVNPEYLANQKLQAKIVLVIMLTINAFALHWVSLPKIFELEDHTDYIKTVLPASISNSIWFYCVFLGVARHWNFSQSIEFILTVWLFVWAAVLAAMYVTIRLAKLKLVKMGASSAVF